MTPSDEVTEEEIGHLALMAMYSAVDEEGQIAVIAEAIRQARREENEACAKVADKELVGGFSISPLTPYGEALNEAATRIAAAIRARVK